MNRLNSFFILFEKVKAESAILQDNRTFWEKYGSAIIGFSILGAFALFLGIVIFCEWYFKRRQEKLAQTTVTWDGVSVATFKTCTVSLIHFEEITLVKGAEFAAPIPDRNGYVFGGWFYDTACTIPYKTTKIRKSITLYPKWIKDS